MFLMYSKRTHHSWQFMSVMRWFVTQDLNDLFNQGTLYNAFQVWSELSLSQT